MARTRKILPPKDNLISPPSPEVAPEGPQADLPVSDESSSWETFQDGIQKTYKLPTGSKRTDN